LKNKERKKEYNMATEIKLPEIGEGVTEGELVKWLVKIGDTLKVDQAFAEVMTDKATVEVPTPVAGVVKALKAKEGDVIKIEQVMIELETSGTGSAVSTGTKAHNSETAKATVIASAASNVVAVQAATPSANISAAPAHQAAGASYYPPPADSKVLATPATRRLARETSVDINGLTGSGLAGRVTREDVLSAKSNGGDLQTPISAKTTSVSIPRPAYQGPKGAVEERVAIRGIRKKIAENMQMSKHIIPHFTLMDEANVSALVEFRDKMKALAEKEGTKITYLPFAIKALIATVRQFSMFNASIDDANQEIVYKKYFNIGFAADTPNGLVVPVIKNADQKTIVELSKEILDLSKRARDGKLKPEEMKGATITITNIGSVGGTYATPIINHPEVAILGMYKIQDKVIVENGDFKVVKVMNFTITADHRLIDGAVAANFLKAFFQRIENPAILMAEMM
jgi:pyruvate dehydrogenase E2 component (dihydrolipoamide acetyltransferase)